MARISYVDPASIGDSQIRQWLEEARREGRPGPAGQGACEPPHSPRPHGRRSGVAHWPCT